MRIIAGLLLAAGAATLTAQSRPPLYVAVSQAEYCGETYIAPSAKSFVFLSGEPIRVRVWLNTSDAEKPHVLTLDTRPHPESAFFAEAEYFSPPLTPASIGQPRKVDLRFRDGASQWVGGVEGRVQWQTESSIIPGSALVWRAELINTLTPGFYRLKVSVYGHDETGAAVRSGIFDFEVREPAPDSGPELLRRAACGHLVNNELEEAEQGVRALLAAWPKSSVAYSLLAMIADLRAGEYKSRGDKDRSQAFAKEKLRHLRKQLELLPQDTLFLKYARPERVNEVSRELLRNIEREERVSR